LDTSALRQWFMTDHMALNLLLADQIVGSSLGGSRRLGGSGLAAQAAQMIRHRSPEARRIGAYVRIVPDGMGRRPALIDPKVVDTVIEAIALGRQLVFGYTSARGNESRWEASPRGLVAKDGTLYLIVTRDHSDHPTTFALHRLRDAHVSTRPVTFRDFDIDRFLEETQHMSHPVGPEAAVDLTLRVAAAALYHFRERPLWHQTIGTPDGQGRVLVTARVPHGVLLTPFLLSMSPDVEVLAPAAVRDEVARRVLDAARHYSAQMPSRRAKRLMPIKRHAD
jgi:predicted DNA-binding transcriptional regulator YafY